MSMDTEIFDKKIFFFDKFYILKVYFKGVRTKSNLKLRKITLNKYYFSSNFSQAASFVQIQNTSIAVLSSSFGGNVGAILMFLSSGSFP